MDWKIYFFVFGVMVGKVTGQMPCYSCSFSSSDSDRSCLEISESTGVVNCPHTYCTILRQEYQDPSGVVASFTRGCEREPVYLNHEIVDDFFRTYYRACTSNLCNIGDGIQSVVGGNLSPHPDYTGENLLVPGTGNGAHSSKISLLWLISSLFVFNFYYK